MTQSAKFHFQWFEKEEHRKRLCASIYADGKLHLGKNLCEALPSDVLVGFDEKNRVLAIADGHGEGISISQITSISLCQLSEKLIRMGLTLPLSFIFSYDEHLGYWLGKVQPRKYRMHGGKARTTNPYDDQQLLSLYRHLIDNAVYQYAKTTPMEERRAIATEALLVAGRRYQNGYGDLETYLAEQIKQHLIQENKVYTGPACHERTSMDAPLTPDDATSSRYDVVSSCDDGGLSKMEEQIMEEEFCSTLAHQEYRFYQMLQAQFSIEQISSALGIPEAEVFAIGQTVADKRRQFYKAA